MAHIAGRTHWIGIAVLLVGATPSLSQSSGSSSGGSTAGASAGSSATPGAPTGGTSIPATGAPAASPFPTTPQRGLGAPQVPSSANAEPTSPVLLQAAPLASTPPSAGVTDPALSGTSSDPQQVENGATGTGTGESGLESQRSTLAPTNRSGTQTPSTATSDPSSPANSQTSEFSSTNPAASAGEAPNATAPTTTDGRVPGQLIAPVPNAVTGSGGTGTQFGSNRAAAGKTLADCMAVWEPATHMTKEQWRRVCSRTSLDDTSTR